MVGRAAEVEASTSFSYYAELIGLLEDERILLLYHCCFSFQIPQYIQRVGIGQPERLLIPE